MYKPAMHRVIRIVLLFILALVSAGGMAPGQQPSASPAKPNPEPTPIQLANVPFEAQSAATSLHEIDASLARIQAILETILETLALIPTVMILRRLLDRNLVPILNALVIMYFVDQLRVLAASLPELTRVLFVGQMLGASLFLFWLLRSRHLRTATAETNVRFLQARRAIAKIGLVFLPAAFLANAFGYVNLGNLLGMIFLRSVYIAVLLYTAIRILEGLITIALQVRPLSSLRVVSLHRSMLQRRTCRILEFSAILLWLNLMLNFFGLLTGAASVCSQLDRRCRHFSTSRLDGSA